MSLGRFRRAGRAALLGAALGAVAPAASAHYGIPRAFSIIFGPEGTNRVLVRSDIWGIMRSWDNGQSWQWSCAEVFGGKSSQAEYHPMVVTSTGRIVVGSSFDGLFLSDNFCEWRKDTSFGSALVADVTTAGSDLLVLTSTSGDTGYDTLLWKSTNQGDSWTKAGTPMPRDFIGSQVRVAPSDSTRVYVVGIAPEGKVGRVQRSDDGGTTWANHEFNFDTTKQIGAYFRLPMVHPTRPDVAFIRVDMPEGLGQDAPDSVLGTKDGGLTWTKLFDSTGDLPGLTLSPDGKTLLIAGPVDGIRSADVDDALTRGPAAFEQVFDGMVWGLNWASDGTLYAGNNNFGGVDVPEITLGVSHDGGRTFELMMNICQIGYPDSCGASTTLAAQCEGLWDNKEEMLGFGYDFVYGERCVAPGGGDGGIAASGDAKGSCACSAPGRSDNSVPAALVLAGIAVVAGRIRRTLRSKDAR
jgi:MYXO-CTERM domain-containing protein